MKKIFISLVLIILIFNISASFYGLIDPDEPRYATTALNMIKNHDYVIPYFNGELRINKPPLTYWLIALSYKLFGINEYAARIPHIFLSILLIVITLYFSRSFLNESERLRYIFIISSSPFFFYLAKYCNTDIVVSTFFTLSLLSFYKFLKTENKSYFFLFFMFYLFANLAKGPVAYLIILIIVVFLFFEKKMNFIFNLKFWLFTIIISITPILYLQLVALLSKGNVDIISLITIETTGRFLKGYRHPEPFYFYLKYFPLLFFPWSIFFILKINKLKEIWKENDFYRLLIIWFIVVFTFFSLSKSKLLSYILPLSFPFALLTSKITSFYSFDYKFNNKILLLLLSLFIIGLCGFLSYKIGFPEVRIWGYFFIGGSLLIFFILFENDTVVKISLFNLFLFFSVFTLGSEFIDNYKSEKFLSRFKKNTLGKKIYSFRRDITGIAYYLGNYEKQDSPNGIKKDSYTVLYKNDLIRLTGNMKNFKIVGESANKIFVYIK